MTDAELLALANAATEGPWHVVALSGGGGMPHYGVGSAEHPEIPIVVYAQHGWDGYGNGSRQYDAEFIAAANPETVKRLLAEKAALRKELDDLLAFLAGGGGQ